MRKARGESVKNEGRSARKVLQVRTCLGCGRKAPKRDLLRFVPSGAGGLEVDLHQRREGRGGYLCPRPTCFQRAVKRKRLAVRFRTDVNVDPDSLVRSVREQLRSMAPSPLRPSKRQPNYPVYGALCCAEEAAGPG